MKTRTIFLLSILMISFSAVSHFAQTPDAVVISLTGKAYFRKGKNEKTEFIKKGQNLFVGQQIRCEKDCKELIISYCNIARPQVNSPKWKTIYAMNCNIARGGRAGSPKGEGVNIVSPRKGEVIQPENFSLKLESDKFYKKVDFILRINLGEQLLSRENVNASSLSFESEKIRKELKTAQENGEFSFAIIIREADRQESQEITFNIISSENQKLLNEDLKLFEDEEDEVFRNIGRGLIFEKYKLFGDAIIEFEKALIVLQNQNNQSNLDSVKELIIDANYHNYNDERVKQLCRSLSNSKQVTDICSRVEK